MELLIAVDAFKRSAAKRVIAVIPYYGYARQDRRPGYTRTAITSKLVANMLQRAGVKQLITIDLHSDQQQGFFDIPVINLSASPLMVADIYRNYSQDDIVIVSPDVGGVKRAREVARQISIDTSLAIVDKRREKANESEVMNVIGDVEGKCCALVDDMIDTAGTLCQAAEALKEKGATKVVAYATHGVFSGKAFDRIEKSCLKEVIVTDTVPTEHTLDGKIRTLSVSSILSEAMLRIRKRSSISQMYT